MYFEIVNYIKCKPFALSEPLREYSESEFVLYQKFQKKSSKNFTSFTTEDQSEVFFDSTYGYGSPKKNREKWSFGSNFGSCFVCLDPPFSTRTYIHEDIY